MECPYLEGVRDRDKGSTLAAPLVLSYHGIPGILRRLYTGQPWGNDLVQTGNK